MKKIKKLLLTTIMAGVLTTPLVANAAVTSQPIQVAPADGSYPIVNITNKFAQHSINQQIKHMVFSSPAFNKEAQNPDVHADYSFSFEVKYEDQDYLSLTLTDYVYLEGAAHGMYNVEGMVFDKHTGKRIPLDYFLNVKDMNLFYAGLKSGILKFYSGDMQKATYSPGFYTDKMSDSYYLGGDGSLYVIFQPYVLGPFSDGATKVYFSPEAVNFFNEASK